MKPEEKQTKANLRLINSAQTPALSAGQLKDLQARREAQLEQIIEDPYSPLSPPAPAPSSSDRGQEHATRKGGGNGMGFTERDERILNLIRDQKFITAEQVVHEFGGNSRMSEVYRRLRKLESNGY